MTPPLNATPTKRPFHVLPLLLALLCLSAGCQSATSRDLRDPSIAITAQGLSTQGFERLRRPAGGSLSGTSGFMTEALNSDESLAKIDWHQVDVYDGRFDTPAGRWYEFLYFAAGTPSALVCLPFTIWGGPEWIKAGFAPTGLPVAVVLGLPFLALEAWLNRPEADEELADGAEEPLSRSAESRSLLGRSQRRRLEARKTVTQ